MSDASFIQRLESMAAEFRGIEQQLSDPDVLSNRQRTVDLSRQRAALEPVVSQYLRYAHAADEARNLEKLADDADPDVRAMAAEELPQVRQRAADLIEKIKGDLVTSEDRAIGSIILEIRAGVGGDEAGIWAGDVLAMYERYAASKGWKWELIEFSPADQGGCRNAIVSLRGEGVWQHLGYEGGTHCVKRVPATETQGRVHTSTATVAVLPEPQEVALHIKDEDVRIDYTTSRGPGGQNVNKVATAVKMLHIPTGIEVRMQDTKSQQQNRQLAWQVMRARVHEHFQRQADAQRASKRNEMIGRGDRSERIRTYRYKDNMAVDHRINESFNLQEITAGRLDPLIDALIQHDKAQRLAAL